MVNRQPPIRADHAGSLLRSAGPLKASAGAHLQGVRVLIQVRRLLVALLLVPVAHASQAAAFKSLLPSQVRPLHYALSITPDAAQLKFSARAEIDLQVIEPTRQITLNALELDIASASVDALPASVKLDPQAQVAVFTLAAALPPGPHRLSIDYTGRIGTQPSGFFALDYSLGGAPRRALYTQFEPADARRVFPCWDEPALKATFSLDLIHADAAGHAISNMPLASRTPLGDGRVRESFARTPKMSTYLLFFGLGDFERQAVRRAGTEVAVITKRGDLPKAEYALAAGEDIVGWYDDYFATPYPLPKLDLIAAPGTSQFFSAMENWGAIFYFERWLLLDPRISSVDDRQAVFSVVAHEVAHQWFGDLVTMGWWDDLWLNEGFASWMGQRAVRHFHPEWHVEMGDVVAREAAIGLDARSSTHAVVQPIENPDALSQAFDSITYSKGAAVIRMLEQYVGEEAWRAGVRDYIRRHAYGNTRSDDLWAAVGAAARKPVLDIAHQFTLQPGVPLIRVEDAQCTQGRSRLKLSQGEFQMDRTVTHARRWQVPVVASAGGAESTLLVTGGPMRAELQGCGPVVVNRGQSGYFRTLYAPRIFAALAARYASLEPVDQLGILSDAWALGLAGQQPPADALNLVQNLAMEAPPEVWKSAAGIIDTLHEYLRKDGSADAALLKLADARLAPKLAQLGWQSKAGEADVTSSLRNALIGTLGELGDPSVVAQARHRFDDDAKTPIPGAQREVILGVVAVNADRATWDKLHAQAKAETTPLIRSQLYRLLAQPRDAALARAALELSLSGEPTETDAASLIAGVAVRHPEMAFDFAVAHTERVQAKVDAGSRNSFMVQLAAGCRDAAILPRLIAWARVHVPRAAYRAVDTVVAGIRYRAGVNHDRMPQVKAWLAQR